LSATVGLIDANLKKRELKVYKCMPYVFQEYAGISRREN